ncbi:hypothetical protein PZE06_05435 [Robertmurraya sp. DFI.2.37]|uniref:hypothetical protein n=1 Tax=Robertmurraya sp. DFI.2.37 TaxID=3031819 RepID=UPI0012444B57|nr:hypothetical protein [Robertmurraya sp. DFI.2.37]MDF1507623.1 hypothetical protein [Robertmurraya sp. DFI.2.37]
MAVTARQVYDLALVHIDEVMDSGKIAPRQPKYYEARAKSLITVLQTELLPQGTEPVIITDLNQEISLPDRVALLVLPYGLAAHLLMVDDMEIASFLNARYEELKNKLPSKIMPIEDVYYTLGGML